MDDPDQKNQQLEPARRQTDRPQRFAWPTDRSGDEWSLAIWRLVPSFIRHAIYHANHRFAQALVREGEIGTKFQMLPIAFGIGAIFYFALPREPLALALAIAVAVCGWAAVATYGRRSGNIWMVVLFVFAGMAAGKLRSDVVDTTMIKRPVQGLLTGLVLNRELRANARVRYTIAVESIDGGRGIVPDIIRATARQKYDKIPVGQGISGLVRLRPPSGPAYPGGYDFAFQSWFKGIGANGFFPGQPKPAKTSIELSWSMRAGLAISAARVRIGTRIRQALPGESGNLAAALIVGDRSGISEKTNEALRRAGLAHILAISGLHMVLVTATIMFLVRATLAILPGIVLYYPIRKWAAFVALAAATIYLGLSGAGIATQRAWIMIAIMLLAVLTDRRALTMRNVGLAALVVLAWRPESIVSPSFQMSFAAVAALIAVYESWARYRRGRNYVQATGRAQAIFGNTVKSLVGLAVTSLVAGIATGLFAAYHFYRIAPLGLLANLAAMPIISIAVMPLALLSVVAMPFGLEIYPLQLMGMAIDKVVVIAAQVASLGPPGNTGYLPIASLLLGSLGLVIATQLKTRLRLFALPVIAAALWSYADSSPPDVIVSESGASLAVFSNDGELRLMRPKKEKFITTIWKKAFDPDQLLQSAKVDTSKSGFRCDDLGCSAILANGLLISVPKRAEALDQDCRMADVIITRFELPAGCTKPLLIIDRQALASRGSHLLRFDGKRLDLQTAYGQFSRPWTRHRF